MIESIWTAASAFVVSNLDDLFLNTLFFAGAKSRKQKGKLLLGKYAGMGLLMLISLLGAKGMGNFPEEWQRLLGMVPVALAVRQWIRRKKDVSSEKKEVKGCGGIEIMLTTLSGGGDFVGVYVPLLLGKSAAQTASVVLVVLLMTGLFCILGRLLLKVRGFQKTLETYQGYLIPLIYLILGVSVLFG